MTDPTTPAPLTDNELAAIRTHTRAYLPSTEDAPILVEAATDRRRLLDEVDRLRADLAAAEKTVHAAHHQMVELDCAISERYAYKQKLDEARADRDRAKAAAAWERGQRRSQSSTLGVKIDQLGIARAEHAALAARLADAEQARDEAISVAAANAAAYDEARAQLAATAAERNEYARAAVDAHNAALTAARWDELVAENNQLIEELAEALGIELDPETGGLASHEPATATGAPDPDPSEGTAPTSRPGGTQRPHETPCLDSPAPLTLDQAAGHLHDWARDLADGTRTDWPAGHADVIRGIRAAADWLDARSAYETEARDTRDARLIGLIGGADG